MTRHVKTLMAIPVDGNVETDAASTLSKKIYDTVNGKTLVSISIARYGAYICAVCVYDD